MKPACTLSIEPAEALFSLATRYCRVMGITLKDVVGNSALNDRTALRDFPFFASRLEAHMRAKFVDRESLFNEHSACQYFGTTIDEPFRSAEIELSTHKAGTLLRSSLGTTWGHLRLCRRCAEQEFEMRRYSWWHRDHQLPLSSICLVHDYPLYSTSLANLGVRLPHELLQDVSNIEVRSDVTQDFEHAVASFEQNLASENRHDMVAALIRRILAYLGNFADEEFDRQKFAFSKVRRVVHLLKQKGIVEPFNDWERVQVAICKVLRGSGYFDPVVTILLIIAFNFPYLIH